MSDKSIEHLYELISKMDSRIDNRFNSIDARLTNFDMRLSNIENRLTRIEDDIRKIGKWIAIENSDIIPDLPPQPKKRQAAHT